MVKDSVAGKVRAMAKAEGKTLTGFMEAVLGIYDTKGAVCDLSDTSIKKLEEGIRQIMQEVLENELRRRG